MGVEPQDQLIIALDVHTAAAARRIVAAVGDSARMYKVGMQLYTAEGPQVIRDLISSSKKVFLDLKYHDIPNTVALAVREAAALGVQMLTVHAMGGEKMLRAATQAAMDSGSDLQVVAVTVLTSLCDADLPKIGVTSSVRDAVVGLAGLAINARCHGVVASAKEARELRRQLGSNFVIVTPGVRPAGEPHADQARVVTPREAVEAGATHIVVGRPILEAADPARAARDILGEMSEPAVRVKVV